MTDLIAILYSDNPLQAPFNDSERYVFRSLVENFIRNDEYDTAQNMLLLAQEKKALQLLKGSNDALPVDAAIEIVNREIKRDRDLEAALSALDHGSVAPFYPTQEDIITANNGVEVIGAVSSLPTQRSTEKLHPLLDARALIVAKFFANGDFRKGKELLEQWPLARLAASENSILYDIIAKGCTSYVFEMMHWGELPKITRFIEEVKYFYPNKKAVTALRESLVARLEGAVSINWERGGLEAFVDFVGNKTLEPCLTHIRELANILDILVWRNPCQVSALSRLPNKGSLSGIFDLNVMSRKLAAYVQESANVHPILSSYSLMGVKVMFNEELERQGIQIELPPEVEARVSEHFVSFHLYEWLRKKGKIIGEQKIESGRDERFCDQYGFFRERVFPFSYVGIAKRKNKKEKEPEGLAFGDVLHVEAIRYVSSLDEHETFTLFDAEETPENHLQKYFNPPQRRKDEKWWNQRRYAALVDIVAWSLSDAGKKKNFSGYQRLCRVLEEEKEILGGVDITKLYVDAARLRLELKAPYDEDYSIRESYALFANILIDLNVPVALKHELFVEYFPLMVERADSHKGMCGNRMDSGEYLIASMYTTWFVREGNLAEIVQVDARDTQEMLRPLVSRRAADLIRTGNLKEIEALPLDNYQALLDKNVVQPAFADAYAQAEPVKKVKLFSFAKKLGYLTMSG